MCFQLNDKSLQEYNKIFETEKSSFILKNKINENVTLYASTESALPTIPPPTSANIQTTTSMGTFMPAITTNF